MCTIPKKINPDIEIERRNCSFDSNEFAEWIWGSKEMLAEKRFVGKLRLCLVTHPIISKVENLKLNVHQKIQGA